MDYGEALRRSIVPKQISSLTELQRIYQQNQLILEAAGEGIYGLDQNGITTFLNPAAAQILGWKMEELLGQPMHEILHHSLPDGRHYPAHQCPIYAAFKDGQVHQVEDEVFWHKEGHAIAVEYTSTPIYENDKLIGAVVVFNDISARQKAQTELKQANQELARMKALLEEENHYLLEEYHQDHQFKSIIGQCPATQQILDQIALVAPTQANVLVQGESGTGKELIARAIHHQSARSNRPMIRVNCAAIPRELFESEFFGHVKGAFTGALKERPGRFQLAHGSSLFLDEVSEIPIDLQSKLLRVLQEGQFEKVGSETTQQTDVRIIAATNCNLKKRVDEGLFREDLYYRLNVFPIYVPPLRERQSDIPILAKHFLQLQQQKYHRKINTLSESQLEHLQSYEWPGNIRELQNIMERAIITAVDGELQFNLPLLQLNPKEQSKQLSYQNNSSTPSIHYPFTEQQRIAMDKYNIQTALKICRGKIYGPQGAANLLGINGSTLASRIKKLDIHIQHQII